MKVKAFDRATCREIRAEITTALHEVAKNYGIVIIAGNGRFSVSDYKLKIECKVASTAVVTRSSGEKVSVTPAEAMFIKHAKRMGMVPEDFGREFKRGSKALKIIGSRHTSQSDWIILEGAKGGKWRLHSHEVRAALAQQAIDNK